jgi:hypothetical protein
MRHFAAFRICLLTSDAYCPIDKIQRMLVGRHMGGDPCVNGECDNFAIPSGPCSMAV